MIEQGGIAKVNFNTVNRMIDRITTTIVFSIKIRISVEK
jgi:hypothetical protein